MATSQLGVLYEVEYSFQPIEPGIDVKNDPRMVTFSLGFLFKDEGKVSDRLTVS